MTQIPSLPRSRRNLSDLDSLIDASIGKSETYGESASDKVPGERQQDEQDAPEASSQPAPSSPERFRVSIDGSVIMATKLLAIQQKVSPSEIVERALRQYLKLPLA